MINSVSTFGMLKPGTLAHQSPESPFECARLSRYIYLRVPAVADQAFPRKAETQVNLLHRRSKG